MDEEPVLSNTGSTNPDMDNNNVIEFDKVNFSYGRERVLHDVSFSINKGEKIARRDRRITKPKITLVRICKNIQECDIDDVANKIFKIGKKKEFPDLTIKW